MADEEVQATAEDVAADVPAAEAPASAASVGAALDAAFATGEVPEGLVGGPARDEAGRFAPKATEPEKEATTEPAKPAPVEPEKPAEPDVPAPPRLSAEARAAWGSVPAPVRSEFTRAMGELQKGLDDYRDRFAALKPYEKMAADSGTTVADALGRYVAMEQELRRDPIAGLDAVCRNMGTDLRTLAAKVLGQPAPDRSATEAELAKLRTEAETYRRQVETFRRTEEERLARDAEEQIARFRAQYPDTADQQVSARMARFLEMGVAETLEEAYHLARTIIRPAPQTGDAAHAPQTGTPAAPQTSKPRSPQIAGINPPASSPARQAKSVDDALRMAFRE